MDLDLVLAHIRRTPEGAIFALVTCLLCYSIYSLIRGFVRDRRSRTGYTIGFRRVNNTTWIKVPRQRTDPQRHYEWAQATSRREGVAEAWVCYRSPEGDITRWYWINGKEDRTESA